MFKIWHNQAASVAIEMAAAIGFLTVGLLSLIEMGTMQIQFRQGDNAYAVFSDLVSSHQGDLSCSQLDSYYEIAFSAFKAGNPAAAATVNDEDNPDDRVGSEEFRLHLAGVRVEEENGDLAARVHWQVRFADTTQYVVDAEVTLPAELLIENQFYFLLQGRTHVTPLFSFLAVGSDGYFDVEVDEQIFLPRFVSNMALVGPQTNWCEYQT